MFVNVARQSRRVALVPASPEDHAKIKAMVPGEVVRATLKHERNLLFHRKWFVLAHLLFDMWSETLPDLKYKGHEVQRNFERFRKDLIILAGYFTPVYNIKGDVRVETNSISFAEMKQPIFEKLYSATIDVGLRTIIPNRGYDENTLRNAVEQVMEFSR